MADTEEAKRLYDKGIDAYRIGEYEEAVETLIRARDIYSQAGDRAKEGEVLNDIGVVYVQMEEWDEANSHLQEALTIRELLGDRSAQGITLGNLGMMYDRMGEDEQAVETYEEAIVICQDLGERGNEKAIARQLSKLQVQRGRFLDAMGRYREGLEEGEEATGAQRLARKMFRVMGRLTGSGAVEDLASEPDEEESEEAAGENLDWRPGPPHRGRTADQTPHWVRNGRPIWSDRAAAISYS